MEQEHFLATCYEAAGWVKVGLTTGRTGHDDGTRPRVPIKGIYLKALRADAQRRLAS